MSHISLFLFTIYGFTIYDFSCRHVEPFDYAQGKLRTRSTLAVMSTGARKACEAETSPCYY